MRPICGFRGTFFVSKPPAPSGMPADGLVLDQADGSVLGDVTGSRPPTVYALIHSSQCHDRAHYNSRTGASRHGHSVRLSRAPCPDLSYSERSAASHPAPASPSPSPPRARPPPPPRASSRTRIALVAIDLHVVIADRQVHQLRIVHVAARRATVCTGPAGMAVDAHVRLRAEVPLIALLRGIVLRMALPHLVLRRRRGGD